MKTHRDIIKAASPQRIADMCGASINTVNSWATRNSIPAERWMLLKLSGIATLDELAMAAVK